jgi:S1-C subfamily serine protease
VNALQRDLMNTPIDDYIQTDAAIQSWQLRPARAGP